MMNCLKLKTNECRTLLLIEYALMKRYLPGKFYNHLQMLAFGITVAEFSSAVSNDMNNMEF